MDGQWDVAYKEAVHKVELEIDKEAKKKTKKPLFKRIKRDNYMSIESCNDKSEMKTELINSRTSPLICRTSPLICTKMNNNDNKRRREAVSERNETERKVVYQTLKNFIQLNHLKNFALE